MSLYVGAICAIPGFPGLNGAPFIGNHDDGYVGLSPTFKDHADNTFQTQRVYVVACNAPGGRVFNGLGVSILSTPRGVLSDNEARAQHVGGEVLCRIF